MFSSSSAFPSDLAPASSQSPITLASGTLRTRALADLSQSSYAEEQTGKLDRLRGYRHRTYALQGLRTGKEENSKSEFVFSFVQLTSSAGDLNEPYILRSLCHIKVTKVLSGCAANYGIAIDGESCPVVLRS